MFWNSTKEVAFSNRDNTNTLQLQDDSADGINLASSDLTAATKVEIVFPGLPLSFNSTEDPAVVAFTTAGVVTLTLGKSNIKKGTHTAYFVVYDAANIKGIRWSPDFQVEIV